ncbi:LuxR C-terminal-related transcriptional regulator [Pendulispora brunnea]|uniref:LuxR C-terminal-related transcriptional regulator n=1 Tax=Pendulispora brunnea TaxID=2905690 RepID=A0ABZ2KKS3_9BACT
MIRRGRPRAAESALTRREREVLDCLPCGTTNREIAGLLGVSTKTVANTLQQVYRKLGVPTRTGASVVAILVAILVQRVQVPPIVFEEALTSREKDILKEAAGDHTNKQIAASLDMPVKTVKATLQRVYRKLVVSTRTRACVVAILHGLIEPPEHLSAQAREIVRQGPNDL